MNLAYCGYLFYKNNNAKLVFGNTSLIDWASAAGMALMWTGSVVFYGWGSNGIASAARASDRLRM